MQNSYESRKQVAIESNVLSKKGDTVVGVYNEAAIGIPSLARRKIAGKIEKS